MADYLLPVAFLVVVFVAFALVNRNRHRGCSGCNGDCDNSRCEKRP